MTTTIINAQEKITYEKQRNEKSAARAMYGNKVVLDEYSHLESEGAPKTTQFIDYQNMVTEQYLRQIPFRESVKSRLTNLWTFEKKTTPYFEKGFSFYFGNDGKKNQSVLYIKNRNGTESELLDPNKLNEKGTTSITSYAISKSAKYIAYALSESGSDWNTIYVMEIETKKVLPDVIKWVKFSDISWKGDEGFYLSKYEEPKKNAKELSEENSNQKIYFYSLSNKEKFKLVYENTKFPKRSFSAKLTDDGNYLVISESESTSGNALFIKNLKTNITTTVSDNFNADRWILKNIGSDFLIVTNENAPNKKVINYNLINKKSTDFIAERGSLLEFIEASKTEFFASWLIDVKSQPEILNEKGKTLKTITLEDIGEVSDVTVDKENGLFYYSFNTFTAPPKIFELNTKTFKSKLTFNARTPFNSGNYITEQLFVTARDGETKIPIFLIHSKDVKLNNNNPCFLFGYGGFSSHYAPEYRIDRALFLEQGGVYAVAGIRGGDEYGEKWHEQGIKLNKKNVFNDFIDVGNYLCDKNITSHEKLAIHGRSNGGLLIGAVVNMAPNLAKVAIPTVGVMDMLKFNKFTIGYLWESDYGNPDLAEYFDYIYSYSPYHNLKANKYPATLVTTGDHDDRVVPAHSFKYAAKMQEVNQSNNPVLIRIDKNAGHGSGKPISKQIDEYVDVWSFVMYNLGMDFKKEIR